MIYYSRSVIFRYEEVAVAVCKMLSVNPLNFARISKISEGRGENT